ncbi:hypothetical protein SVIOM342S_05008 [Streptomyces violaceorubidus]
MTHQRDPRDVRTPRADGVGRTAVPGAEEHPVPVNLAERIGPYRPIRHLGTGGMGTDAVVALDKAAASGEQTDDQGTLANCYGAAADGAEQLDPGTVHTKTEAACIALVQAYNGYGSYPAYDEAKAYMEMRPWCDIPGQSATRACRTGPPDAVTAGHPQPTGPVTSGNGRSRGGDCVSRAHTVLPEGGNGSVPRRSARASTRISPRPDSWSGLRSGRSRGGARPACRSPRRAGCSPRRPASAPAGSRALGRGRAAPRSPQAPLRGVPPAR